MIRFGGGGKLGRAGRGGILDDGPDAAATIGDWGLVGSGSRAGGREGKAIGKELCVEITKWEGKT